MAFRFYKAEVIGKSEETEIVKFWSNRTNPKDVLVDAARKYQELNEDYKGKIQVLSTKRLAYSELG